MGKVSIIGEGARDDAGQRQGLWEFAYSTGERYAGGEFVDGSREGEWCYWYPNGTLAARGQHDDHGLRGLSGRWEYWYPSGALGLRATYDDVGWECGERREWYDNGQLASVSTFEMDDETGPISLWHRNGCKFAEGASVEDMHVGEWTYWHDNGQLAFVEVKNEPEPREGFFARDGASVDSKEFWERYLEVFALSGSRNSQSAWPQKRCAGVRAWSENEDELEAHSLLDDLLWNERSEPPDDWRSPVRSQHIRIGYWIALVIAWTSVLALNDFAWSELSSLITLTVALALAWIAPTYIASWIRKRRK